MFQVALCSRALRAVACVLTSALLVATASAQAFDPVVPLLGTSGHSVVADLDGNGYPDIITPLGATLRVMMNPGLNPLAQSVLVTPGPPNSTSLLDQRSRAAHLRSAALPDYVASWGYGASMMLNDGAGNLGYGGELPFGCFADNLMDINGDGLDDCVTSNAVWLNTGNATFVQTMSMPFNGPNRRIKTADLTGDGLPEVLAFTQASGDFSPTSLQTFRNVGGGVFVPAWSTPLTSLAGGGGTFGNYVGAFDMNGDGFADLVFGGTPFGVPPPPGCVVHVFRGNGDATFQAPVTFVLAASGGAIRVRDFDGDGLPDILFQTSDFPPGQLGIAYGSLTTMLMPAQAAGGPPAGVYPAANHFYPINPGGLGYDDADLDLDGDGIADSVVVAFRDQNYPPLPAPPPALPTALNTPEVWMVRGLGGGVFSNTWVRMVQMEHSSIGGFADMGSHPSAFILDMDNDGDLDVLCTGVLDPTSMALNRSRYGRGCTGFQGSIPEITCGTLTVGNAAFGITLFDAAPNATAILGISTAATPSQQPCSLMINLDAEYLLSPVGSFGITTTDATGVAFIGFAIPADPGVIGFTAYAQWGVIDPLGGLSTDLGNLALTVGKTLIIGQ